MVEMIEKLNRGTDLAHLGHGKAMKPGSIIKAKLPKVLFIICGLQQTRIIITKRSLSAKVLAD